MSYTRTFAFGLMLTAALSTVGCAAETEGDDDDLTGETSDAVVQSIRVTNPNNASYSNIDGALGSWIDWACMVSAGSKARAVSEQFTAKQKATPVGTKVYWTVYGKYLNGDKKCIVSYNVSFAARAYDPPIIPLDHRGRPLASYRMGFFEGTKR